MNLRYSILYTDNRPFKREPSPMVHYYITNRYIDCVRFLTVKVFFSLPIIFLLQSTPMVGRGALKKELQTSRFPIAFSAKYIVRCTFILYYNIIYTYMAMSTLYYIVFYLTQTSTNEEEAATH